jgi:3',5'-nucleoside bisphosphate phosphatase
MNDGIDLHIHTAASDGLHTPSEVVGLAQAAGLRTIAITDHDTLGGLAEAVAAARGTGLEVIRGVEISTEAPDAEVHILGYYVNDANQEFGTALVRLRNARMERAQAMLNKLQALRITLSWSRVHELAQGGTVGRPHIARALQEAGYVSSVQEAFDRFLGRGRPAYVSRYKVTPAEAIRLIRLAEGVAVLAHPWELTALLPGLVAEGLAGLETYYANYAPEVKAILRRQAEHYGLLCTGGSDFHGLDLLPENRLGTGKVPPECLAALRAHSRNLRLTN